MPLPLHLSFHPEVGLYLGLGLRPFFLSTLRQTHPMRLWGRLCGRETDDMVQPRGQCPRSSRPSISDKEFHQGRSGLFSVTDATTTLQSAEILKFIIKEFTCLRKLPKTIRLIPTIIFLVSGHQDWLITSVECRIIDGRVHCIVRCAISNWLSKSLGAKWNHFSFPIHDRWLTASKFSFNN